MEKPLRFIVMGDTHYVQPEAHQRALNGQPSGVTEVADITRNYWMTQHVLPETIEQIARLRPDFIIQTGDIIQGHCDDEAGNMREMTEALELLKGLQAPLYFALGTHDGVVGKLGGEPVEQLVYPAISRELDGVPVAKGYYSFEKEGSLFVVLDYTTFRDSDDQDEFISRILAQSGSYEHVFLFAHPPLIPVGRPFFTHFDFVQKVLREIADHPIDAYFCGHTHNQITSLHRVGDHWLPQLKSTILGYPDQQPVTLTDVRPLMPNPDQFEYGWGYLEDSAPGWWMITVNGPEVQADWHMLNRGVQGQLRWRRGEKPDFVQIPQSVKTFGLPLPQLHETVSVRLRAAGSGCRTTEGYKVTLNGTDIGFLPHLEYFDCRQLLEIDEKFWPLLRNSNKISVTTANDSMCIGGFVLEVETRSGCVRSSVSSYYANSNRWDKWGDSPLQSIEPGETIYMDLVFG